jgi:hypothetical protein
LKVFLAGIIQGSLVEARIHSQDWRDAVKGVLARHLGGADVYCHYSRHPQSIAYDLPAIRATFEDGVAKAAECDLLVAYLPSASMGTAIEMHEASRAGAVVVAITPMSANWVVRLYGDAVVADVEALEALLASGGLERLLKRKKKSQPRRPRRTQGR